MQKRGSSLRTLLNIGWVLIIGLAIVGALTYFNIVAPDFFKRSKCELTETIKCIDARADPVSVELTIKNNLGYAIKNVSMSLTSEECTSEASDESILFEGDIIVYQLPCELEIGKLEADISIKFVNNDTNSSVIKNGELVVEVK